MFKRIFAGMAMALTVALQAQTAVDGPAQKVVLIELFTSEGMLQLPSGGRIAPAGERKPDQREPVGSRHQRACYLLEWAWLV